MSNNREAKPQELTNDQVAISIANRICEVEKEVDRHRRIYEQNKAEFSPLEVSEMESNGSCGRLGLHSLYSDFVRLQDSQRSLAHLRKDQILFPLPKKEGV